MARLTEERALTFIRSPEKWLWYPILPMKRTVAGKKHLDLGVVVWPDTTTVILGNMCRLPGSRMALRELPREVYVSIETMLLAGWEVD